MSDPTEAQKVVCRRKKLNYVPSNPGSKLGFAIETQGKVPINGLRHPPAGETNGWYIWCGEDLSEDPDFFSPMHTVHLLQTCPEVLPLLGLPPGSRFLIADDYEDIWFDESLLNV